MRISWIDLFAPHTQRSQIVSGSREEPRGTPQTWKGHHSLNHALSFRLSLSLPLHLHPHRFLSLFLFTSLLFSGFVCSSPSVVFTFFPHSSSPPLPVSGVDGKPSSLDLSLFCLCSFLLNRSIIHSIFFSLLSVWFAFSSSLPLLVSWLVSSQDSLFVSPKLSFLSLLPPQSGSTHSLFFFLSLGFSLSPSLSLSLSLAVLSSARCY